MITCQRLHLTNASRRLSVSTQSRLPLHNMFSTQSMIEETPLVPSRQPTNGQRVLACLLCQQRKIKCDRQFPCANCIKTRAECNPGTKIACRRKRFPEKKLLDRLRHYEDLLNQNHIDFEPLNPDLIPTDSLNYARKDSSENWSSSPSIVSDHHVSPTRYVGLLLHDISSSRIY